MSRSGKQAVGKPNRTLFSILNSLITWGYRNRVEFSNDVNKGIHEGLKQYICIQDSICEPRTLETPRLGFVSQHRCLRWHENRKNYGRFRSILLGSGSIMHIPIKGGLDFAFCGFSRIFESWLVIWYSNTQLSSSLLKEPGFLDQAFGCLTLDEWWPIRLYYCPSLFSNSLKATSHVHPFRRGFSL